MAAPQPILSLSLKPHPLAPRLAEQIIALVRTQLRSAAAAAAAVEGSGSHLQVGDVTFYDDADIVEDTRRPHVLSNALRRPSDLGKESKDTAVDEPAASVSRSSVPPIIVSVGVSSGTTTTPTTTTTPLPFSLDATPLKAGAEASAIAYEAYGAVLGDTPAEPGARKKNTCFNCGSEEHGIGECPEPLDVQVSKAP
jgi:hypothetical protein